MLNQSSLRLRLFKAGVSSPISCEILKVVESELSAPRFGLEVIKVDTCFEAQALCEIPALAQAKKSVAVFALKVVTPYSVSIVGALKPSPTLNLTMVPLLPSQSTPTLNESLDPTSS